MLARSSAGKLARLLLSWGNGREREGGTSEIRIKSSLTHEEIAQMIGSSRETVTRLLSELKKKEMIRLEGSTLVILQSQSLWKRWLHSSSWQPLGGRSLPAGRLPLPQRGFHLCRGHREVMKALLHALIYILLLLIFAVLILIGPVGWLVLFLDWPEFILADLEKFQWVNSPASDSATGATASRCYIPSAAPRGFM